MLLLWLSVLGLSYWDNSALLPELSYMHGLGICRDAFPSRMVAVPPL